MRIRAPMAVGLVKSIGPPATFAISPVGISVASTGVKAEALSMSSCSRMLPEPRPQIEVGVVGEVDDGRAVRRCLVVDSQLVLLGEV